MTHVSEEQMALYAGSDLQGNELRAVEEHLQQCADCRTVTAEFRDSAEMLQAAFGEPRIEDLEAVRQGIAQRIHRPKAEAPRWLWAAAAMAAMVIAAVLFLRKEHAPGKELAAATEATLQVPQKPLLEPELGNLTLQRARVKRRQAPGLRTVTLVAERGGPPVLKMTTSDPDVVILWQVTKGQEEAHD